MTEAEEFREYCRRWLKENHQAPTETPLPQAAYEVTCEDHRAYLWDWQAKCYEARLIGYFQAEKHPIVNMMIMADETRSLVYNAACAYDHEPEEALRAALRAALLAKSSASDTALFCSERDRLHARKSAAGR